MLQSGISSCDDLHARAPRASGCRNEKQEAYRQVTSSCRGAEVADRVA